MSKGANQWLELISESMGAGVCPPPEYKTTKQICESTGMGSTAVKNHITKLKEAGKIEMKLFRTLPGKGPIPH